MSVVQVYNKPGLHYIIPDRPKFATHVVLFGQDKWIMRNLANAYPHVDRIYVAYSEKPWAYNPNARNQYKNSFDLDLIRKSEFADKITIIEGVWDTEEQQRNACAEQAEKDRIDYLIIQDADEFYFHSGFEKILRIVEKNPDYDFYKIHWRCFWKNLNYVLVDSIGFDFTGCPEFCINLKRGVRFASKRRPMQSNWFKIKYNQPDLICFHASYVLTDDELLQKINTWGHTNDFDKEYWYKEKWLKWTPDMTDLHLVSPSAWAKAIPFTGNLPEVIADMR